MSLTISCTTTPSGLVNDAHLKDDPFLWLEEVEGERALSWVREQNKVSLSRLEKDSRYKQYESEALKILQAKDRIPYGTIRGNFVYNFWQDEKNVRGLWRRTTYDSYLQNKPEWEVLLDIDKLANKEKQNWVYKGAFCLPTDDSLCLLSLSDGGSDAEVIREFDLRTRRFVTGGFVLPEAKSSMSWLDKDTVLVGTDFGEESLTTSGYPRQIRLWKRGTPLASAPILYEGQKTDVGVGGFTHHHPRGTHTFIGRSITFYTSEMFLVDGEKTIKVPVPDHYEFQGVLGDDFLFTLRKEDRIAGTRYNTRTLLSLDLGALKRGETKISEVYQADKDSTLSGVALSRDFALLHILANVQSRVIKLAKDGSQWRSTAIALPPNGTASILAVDAYSNRVFFNYQNYLTSPRLYAADISKPEDPRVIASQPERFKADHLKMELRYAKSKDGTKVPYYLVFPKNMKADGENPTLLYAYGGFEISLLPSYWSGTGKLWLERGGVLAVANIRGGGEFGPSWHQAALKENRQRAFDDFYAVAEDLIRTGVTRPQRLGIEGGSNGGLLMGVALTQRPDLFGAVISQVPLLDMLRYSKLLAGASWMGEYGDPDIPKERATLLSYSPYHQLKPETQYPEPLFITSTKDDRVHPGHARKMVARMREMNLPVLYYENIEGGHAASANLRQKAKMTALETVYLDQKLRDPRSTDSPVESHRD